MNKKGAGLLGLKEEKIINLWFGVFVPQYDRREFHKHFTNTTDKHVTQEFEYKIKTRYKKFLQSNLKSNPFTMITMKITN